MMADQWYYTKNGLSQGPVSEDELKNLLALEQVQQTDLVWKEGLAQWIEARTIGVACPATAPIPGTLLPPIPGTASANPPVAILLSTDAPTMPTTMATLLTPKEIRQKIENLKQSIIQQVLDQQADLPDIESIKIVRKEHRRLQEQLAQLQNRLEDLEKAKAEHGLLESAYRQKNKHLAIAEKSLRQFARPLGRAAFAALGAGQLQDQPLFKDRFDLSRRIGELKTQIDRLAPPINAGMIQHAKSVAQQLLVGIKIKIEELKIGWLDKQIGQELLTSNQETSVQCDTTAEILAAIAGQRRIIAQGSQEADQARQTFNQKKTDLAQSLKITNIESTKIFYAERRGCLRKIADIEKNKIILEKEIPEQLLAVDVPESDLGRLVQALRETQSQLAAASRSEATTGSPGVPKTAIESSTAVWTEAPRLWNPQAVGQWSFVFLLAAGLMLHELGLFLWAIGPFLLARNWCAIGNEGVRPVNYIL